MLVCLSCDRTVVQSRALKRAKGFLFPHDARAPALLYCGYAEGSRVATGTMPDGAADYDFTDTATRIIRNFAMFFQTLAIAPPPRMTQWEDRIAANARARGPDKRLLAWIVDAGRLLLPVGWLYEESHVGRSWRRMSDGRIKVSEARSGLTDATFESSLEPRAVSCDATADDWRASERRALKFWFLGLVMMAASECFGCVGSRACLGVAPVFEAGSWLCLAKHLMAMFGCNDYVTLAGARAVASRACSPLPA